jgi:protein-S-isoprenylcysteine O-methyltransferase Ste14
MGLWLKPCSQIHMIGMRYALDLVFLDDELRVVRTIAGIQPGKISPKVSEATSVLELPSGTLDARPLADGTRLAIDGDPAAELAQGGALAAAFVNVALAFIYLAFAGAHLTFGMRTGEWPTVAPIVAQESLLVMLFLTRRRSTAVSTHGIEWVTSFIGTFLPLLFRPTDPPGAIAVGVPLQVAGLLLVLLAVSSLGRSFGVIPAHRGIKTAGLYGFVRHPLYTAHLVSYVGYAISNPSTFNLSIFATTMVALNMRAVFEERLLSRDPIYSDYTRRVPWRFLPHLY